MNTKTFAAAAVMAAVASTPAQSIPIAFDFSGTVQSREFFDAPSGVRTFDPSAAGQSFSARMIIETNAFTVGSVNTFATWRSVFASTGFTDTWSSALTIAGVPIEVKTYELNQAYAEVDENLSFSSTGGVNDSVSLVTRSDRGGPLGVTDSSLLWWLAYEPLDLSGGTPSTYTNLDTPFSVDSLLTVALPNLTLSYGTSHFDCQALNLCFFQSSDTTRFNVTSVSRSIRQPDVSVPEPGTLSLLALGLLGAGIARRRRNG
ncbi:MAG: PEP-CTERM sorting domain-containing protein [Steroidobacteraceae bacterium]|nr:PEP-CTERM sorting domain-containing protein [Steroidobacteraceae bacterium]